MKTYKDARAAFISVVKNKNFLTPEIITYKFIGNYVVEVSRGDSMSGGDLFGVTVVDWIAKEPRHDLSKAFSTRFAMNKHIKALNNL